MNAKEFKSFLPALLSGETKIVSAKFRGTKFRASRVLKVRDVAWVPSFKMLYVTVECSTGDISGVYVKPSNLTVTQTAPGSGESIPTMPGMLFYFFSRGADGQRDGGVFGEWFDSPEARDEYCRVNSRVCLGYDYGTAASHAAHLD